MIVTSEVTMTSRGTAWVGVVLFLVVAMGALAMAHHSFAVFDHNRTLTIRGTVTKFQWTNPHAFLEVDIPQADGTTRHFSIELTSINMMQRVGWRSNMIKGRRQGDGDRGAPAQRGAGRSRPRSDDGGWLHEGAAGAEHRRLQADARGAVRRS